MNAPVVGKIDEVFFVERNLRRTYRNLVDWAKPRNASDCQRCVDRFPVVCPCYKLAEDADRMQTESMRGSMWPSDQSREAEGVGRRRGEGWSKEVKASLVNEGRPPMM